MTGPNRSQTQWDPQYPLTVAEEPPRLLESEEQLWQRDRAQPGPERWETEVSHKQRHPSEQLADTPEDTPSKVVATSIALLTSRVRRLELWAEDVQGALASILECLDGLELESEDDNEEEPDA